MRHGAKARRRQANLCAGNNGKKSPYPDGNSPATEASVRPQGCIHRRWNSHSCRARNDAESALREFRKRRSPTHNPHRKVPCNAHRPAAREAPDHNSNVRNRGHSMSGALYGIRFRVSPKRRSPLRSQARRHPIPKSSPPDWTSEWDDGELVSAVESGASAKLGTGYRTKRLTWNVHGFGRYYYDPELPVPQAYAHYRELSDAEYAWVSGASGTLEARTLHHFALGTNASSIYGEYSLADGRSLPWQANSRLDMVTFFRYYPRKDSLVSVVLSHHAAWHRPLYYYEIKPSNTATGDRGTRKIRDYNDFTDLYRTDIRVNLDLKGNFAFFRDVRFYVEADNVFANLDSDALRFLGSDNDRQRSQVTDDYDGVASNGYKLIPFMAKGMGLYLQFGVEANFRI